MSSSKGEETAKLLEKLNVEYEALLSMKTDLTQQLEKADSASKKCRTEIKNAETNLVELSQKLEVLARTYRVCQFEIFEKKQETNTADYDDEEIVKKSSSLRRQVTETECDLEDAESQLDELQCEFRKNDRLSRALQDEIEDLNERMAATAETMKRLSSQ